LLSVPLKTRQTYAILTISVTGLHLLFFKISQSNAISVSEWICMAKLVC